MNGIDLREVDFVEVEEEVKDQKTGEVATDPKTGQPKVRIVKLERHEYLRTNLLNGWPREVLEVAWRKVGDIIKLADEKSREGVKFLIPLETPEERLRSLVGDVREAMQDVPDGLLTSILEEAGLMRTSTAEELKKAMEKADELRREQEPPQATPWTPPQPTSPQPSAQELMQQRTPLNASPQAAPPPSPPPPGPPQVPGATATRAKQIEAMEGGLDLDVPVPPPGDPSMTRRHVVPGAQTQPNAPHLQTAVPPAQGATVLSQKGREQVDLQQFNKIVETRPTGGINPRFRPPPRSV